MIRSIMLVAALMYGLAATQFVMASDWQAVLEAEHRTDQNRQRDHYRHPAQTLAFFGLQGDMTVVEISPGGSGWYTEILAPILKDDGKLYAAHYALNPPHRYYRNSLGQYLQKLAAHDEVYRGVVVTQLQPPIAVETAPAGTADMALTFRNVHNWMESGHAQAVIYEAFKSLKPGGIFGVVEHRAKPGASLDMMIESGYVTEAKVIELVQAAGFELVERSEINANSKDSADHPEGVWTLPPSLRLGDEQRDHYLAIGESDRMTLKFRKP